jgi:hypothetical protein
MNPRWDADRAVADRSEDGPEAAIASEANAHMMAAFKTLASCFYYGNEDTQGQTKADVKGFPGLLQSYSTDYELNAGGTTADTGTSIWGVKFGVDLCRWVYGENGQLDLSDVDLRDVFDANNKPYTAYVQELLAYPGLQVANLRAVMRIKNITADAGATVDDDMIADLLEKAEVGWWPDVFFMARRSIGQLRKSRTATSGSGAPAPFPTEVHGVPIAVTDSIRITESVSV